MRGRIGVGLAGSPKRDVLYYDPSHPVGLGKESAAASAVVFITRGIYGYPYLLRNCSLTLMQKCVKRGLNLPAYANAGAT